MHSQPSITNAFTVDVEEYYHATLFREATGSAPPGGYASRVESSVATILQLLELHRVRATFFILGAVADAHPSLVKDIAKEGHEIGCHGYAHELVTRQTPGEFRADVQRSKRLLEDLSGQAVIGYRAPSFSIGPTQRWAFDILLEEGFSYDSSVYPIFHDRYGDPNAPRAPHEIRSKGSRRLLEFPIGTLRLFGARVPIGGGGYFRLLPVAVIAWGIRRTNTREGIPAMFYLHPWELDPGMPQPPMAWRYRFRHYVGVRQSAVKLATLLRDIPFTAACEILDLTPDLPLGPCPAPGRHDVQGPCEDRHHFPMRCRRVNR